MTPTLLLLALSLPVPGGPHNVLPADLNADRRPDLLIATRDEIVVLLHQGGGAQLRETARLKLTRPASELAAADFNRDGHLDVAVADHDTFAIVILHGDGKGSLRLGPTVRAKQTGKPHIHGLAAGDLNGDRHPDLVLASGDEHELIPLLNDGHGLFTPQPAARARSPWHPVLADLNHDGHLDLIAAAFDGKTIATLLGNGRGGFAEASRHETFPRAFMAKVADLNGDSHPDLYAVHDDHGRLTILYGDGKGVFTPAPGSPFDIGAESYGTQALGRDIYVCTLKGELKRFTGRAVEPASGSKCSYRLDSADLDGDGSPELVTVDPDSNQVHAVKAQPRARN